MQNSTIVSFKVTSNDDVGIRIDKLLSDRIEDLSRTAVANLCDDGKITSNNIAINKKYKVALNDEFFIQMPKNDLELIPENIPLNIVYEDDYLLVINKVKGMVVHPAPGNPNGTLVNALLYHCGENLSKSNGDFRAGIVHRIDKDTSGLLVVAKDDVAYTSLSSQIKSHSFDRFYEAVVYGSVKNDSGFISEPIGRHNIDRKKMCVTDKNSKDAITHYEVIKRYNGFTHMKFKLETGRTHQIRVHLSYIGHPIVGDEIYGPKKVIKELNGQCLHAKTIEFIHPITNEKMFFDSDLPEYFTKFLSKLKEI